MIYYRYPNYGSEEVPHLMLLPTIQAPANWYSGPDYPAAFEPEVIGDDFKRVIVKRGDQMALSKIFSRLRSRNTKDQK